MDTAKTIFERRSVRKYIEKAIPHEDVVEIMEAACMAPSAVNTQPWFFVVLESKEAIEEYRQFAKEGSAPFRKTLEARFPNNPEVVDDTMNFLTSMGNAPVIVLAFLGKSDFNDSGKSNGYIQSVASAIENMILYAWDKGIASCWTSSQIKAGMSENLEARYAPGKGNFVAAISMGYAEKVPAAPKRRTGKVVFI